MLRIIAGKYRGKKLLLPPQNITRPMRDIVKESIFSMLHFDIPKSIILDAFSGSGSLAIEAVSRGATKVIALENNNSVLKILNQNVDDLKINNIEIIPTDVLSYFKKSYGLQFKIIFLDPPFKDYDLTNQILELIAKNDNLHSYGFIILHTDNPKKIILPAKMLILKHKKYGLNHILEITNIL